MGKALKRLLTRLVPVVVAVLAAYAGWKWGHRIFPGMEKSLGIGRAEAAHSPTTRETAARAAARIEEFRDSEEAQLRLDSSEVSSLLRSVPGVLPEGVVEPTVTFEEDRIAVHARVLPAEMPDVSRLGGIAGLLPDTVDVRVVGPILPSSGKGTLLLIEVIELQGWPVPPGSFPEILARLGGRPPPGAPASSVVVPAIRGLRGSRVEDGRLVLVRVR